MHLPLGPQEPWAARIEVWPTTVVAILERPSGGALANSPRWDQPLAIPAKVQAPDLKSPQLLGLPASITEQTLACLARPKFLIHRTHDSFLCIISAHYFMPLSLRWFHSSRFLEQNLVPGNTDWHKQTLSWALGCPACIWVQRDRNSLKVLTAPRPALPGPPADLFG